MTDTASTDLAVFQQGDLDPVTARQFAAQWREASRLAMTAVIPKTITHTRQNVGGQWQDVPQDPAVVRATVFAVVRYGAEVFGYPGPVALGKVDVIEGRLEPRYDALIGRMLDAGHQVRTVEMTAQRAAIKVRRAEDVGDPDGWQLFEFTLEEALAAGYVKERPADRDLRGAWYTRRADMLMSKAAKRAFRLSASDTLVQRELVDMVEGASVEQMVAPARAAGVVDTAAAEVSPSAPPASQRHEEVQPQPAPRGADGEDIVDAEIVGEGRRGQPEAARHSSAPEGFEAPPSPAGQEQVVGEPVEQTAGDDDASDATADVEPAGDQPDGAPPASSGVPDPDDDEARARARRGLMAQATKAFPKDPQLLPAAARAKQTAQRHAIAYVALGGVWKSANDMTVAELQRVTVALRDVEEGRAALVERDGRWVAVLRKETGDREIEIPAEPEVGE